MCREEDSHEVYQTKILITLDIVAHLHGPVALPITQREYTHGSGPFK